MPSTAVSAPNTGSPRIPTRGIVDALVRIIRNEFPIMTGGMVLTEQILKRIYETIKKNIVALVGSALTSAGIAALLPSLCVLVVNAVGFTQGGVAAGSLAAFIQSVFWGANTGGIFSVLQAFGATAAIASPAVLVVGGICFGVGMGFLGYWLWKKYGRRGQGGSTSSSQEDDLDPSSRGPRYLIDSDGSSNTPRAAVLSKADKFFSLFDIFRTKKEKFD